MEGLAIALAVAVGFPLLMYFAQDSLIFHPQPVGESRRAALAAPGVAESIFIEGRDARVHAWYVKGEPLIMYFGGNAEEVSWMLQEATERTPGIGWLLVDYRGYGSSGGSPSEAALVADAIGWYDKMKSEHKTIYAFGRSLGSGVAVQLAAERPLAGLILVAPFDSLVEVGKRHYPFLPVSLLLKHRFRRACARYALAAPLHRRHAGHHHPACACEAALRGVGRAETLGRARRRRSQQHRRHARLLGEHSKVPD